MENMRKAWLLIVVIFAVFGILLGIAIYVSKREQRTSAVSGEEIHCPFNVRRHPIAFFDEEYFWRHREKNPKKVEGGRGAIIPHHLLPGEIISGTLGALSSESITTVVLIGTNHFEKGETSFLTDTASWETPFGVLEADANAVCDVLRYPSVSEDFDFLSQEHSLSGIVSYIKYFFPNAKIIPFAVSKKSKETEKRDIADILSNFVKSPNAVVIAAVDFSHILSSEESREKDKISLETMLKRDFEKLKFFGNDFVDSPGSIEIFLRVMDNIGAGKLHVLYNADSGTLTQNTSGRVTSYFGIVAAREDL